VRDGDVSHYTISDVVKEIGPKKYYRDVWSAAPSPIDATLSLGNTNALLPDFGLIKV
jgi:hypothetical protein